MTLEILPKYNASVPKCINSMQKLNLQPMFIPDQYDEDFHEELSTYDDEYADLYLSDELSDEARKSAIQRIFYSRKAIPLIAGSAKNNENVSKLLDVITELIVSDNFEGPIKRDDRTAYAFKVTTHPRYGDVTMFRNFGLSSDIKGIPSLKNYSQSQQKDVKSKFFKIHGLDLVPADSITPNEVFAVRNNQINAGDYVGLTKLPSNVDSARYENDSTKLAPSCSMTIETDGKTSVKEVTKILDNFKRQDQSLDYEIDKDTDQIILKGIGSFHLEIVVSRLANEHKVKEQEF